MSRNPPTKPFRSTFTMNGRMSPLMQAERTGWKPSRPMGGWLAVWALLMPDGTMDDHAPMDRDDHWFEAASELSQIDFSDYLATGVWNDTHIYEKPEKGGTIVVGVPTSLEHHDAESDLSRAHGKVGWWTEGHLFDRDDPASWRNFTTHEPTARDLDRADYYWSLANLLKGTPRDLGISAEGAYLESPCKRRILWAQVKRAAICEIPKAPASTVRPLELGMPIRRGMVGASPCDSCTCPPGLCQTLRLNKAIAQGQDGVAELREIPERPALAEMTVADRQRLETKILRIARMLVRRYGLTKKEALSWVRRWVGTATQPPDSGA